MPPSRRRALLAVWLLLTLFQLVHLLASGVQAAHAQPLVFADPVVVELNHARAPVLALLPGIGRGRAEAIVLHRVRFGPFRRIEDLLDVDGIGVATLDQLAPFVRL